MTIEEFRIRFDEIRNQGFVRSYRRGPTGIGKTLEELLGIDENNIALPDLGEIEIKAHRVGSQSMITLFTFNRKAWRMKPLDAVRNHGTKDRNDRIGLYFTMSRVPNSSGLFLHIDDTTISVRHIGGTVVAEWKLVDLAQQFIKKIPALILVTAIVEERGGEEWFHFTRAQLLRSTTTDILSEQIIIGNVLVDLRLHDQITRARNHGTGFRTLERNLVHLFRDIQEL